MQMASRASIHFLGRNSQTILIGGAIAFAFIAGLAIGNYDVTNDALKGQANYFVKDYTPKAASRAAWQAKQWAQQNCPSPP